MSDFTTQEYKNTQFPFQDLKLIDGKHRMMESDVKLSK